MNETNPFKKIGEPPIEPSISLKKKVMDSVESIKLLKEVTTLFTANYASTIGSFFKQKKKN